MLRVFFPECLYLSLSLSPQNINSPKEGVTSPVYGSKSMLQFWDKALNIPIHPSLLLTEFKAADINVEEKYMEYI